MGRPEHQAMHIEPLDPIANIERVTFGNIFGWSHRVMSWKWGLLVGCAASLVIYEFVVSFFLSMAIQFAFGTGVLFNPLEFLHSILVIAPLSVGPIYIAAKIFRGQRAVFDDIWIGFTRWAPIVLIGFLIQAGYLIAMVPIGVMIAMSQRATAGNSALTILLMLVLGLALLVGSVYIAVRLYFATLLCADPMGPKLGGISAITESWRITRNSAWTLFLTAIVISIIAGISAACLFIPLILYGLPLTYGAAGAVYVILTHQSGIIPVEGYDVCPYCEYDISTLDTSQCPECGSHVIRPQDLAAASGYDTEYESDVESRGHRDSPLGGRDDDPPEMRI